MKQTICGTEFTEVIVAKRNGCAGCEVTAKECEFAVCAPMHRADWQYIILKRQSAQSV